MIVSHNQKCEKHTKRKQMFDVQIFKKTSCGQEAGSGEKLEQIRNNETMSTNIRAVKTKK